MATSLSSALVRVLALASGMAAGAVLGLGIAVALTPEGAPQQTPLLLVLQGKAQMMAQPHSAPAIRTRS
jgi:hypothetical protein